MTHKDKLINGLEKMNEILNAPEESQAGTSKNEGDTGIITKEDKKQLLALVQEMLETAAALPSTEQQSPSTSFFSGIAGLPSLKSPFSSKKIQVFMPIQMPSSNQFAAALSKLYTCEIKDRIPLLQSDLPLVVVCPVSSRIEPDIDHALEGLKLTSAFIALVLHFGTESSLPRLPTATRMPDKEKYKHATFIDMAFTMESKIYKCRMNEIAKEELKSFIERYYKSK